MRKEKIPNPTPEGMDDIYRPTENDELQLEVMEISEQELGPPIDPNDPSFLRWLSERDDVPTPGFRH